MAPPVVSNLPLEDVEKTIARLWDEEARQSGTPRIELLTLVALVSEPSLAQRARRVVDEVVRAHPSRTIVAQWTEGAPQAGIVAQVGLHRTSAEGRACGDAITLDASGAGREWLPDNVERLALADLPVCVWWVGDLPDFDHLFDRMLGCADIVVVNSGEMDLRDLEKLSEIVARSNGRYALSDLAWVRLGPVRELIARFFDDETARACLASVERVTIEFTPREHELDVASTQAALLFGWMACALGLRAETVRWDKRQGSATARLGRVVTTFEPRPRGDLPPGSLVRVALECDGARFEIERQEDPCVFRWSREVPGAAMPSQTLRVSTADEAALLARSLEAPERNPLLERSLHAASRIVRVVAPRLSPRPNP